MIMSLVNSSIFGLPLVIYLGILTYLSFLFTATLGFFFFIGKPLLPFRWHPIMAVVSLVLGLIHGTFVFLAVFVY